MLQKMGWKDGLGLGKKNQGRTEIIQTQSRMAQSGLGNYIWSLTLIVLYIIPNNFQELHNPRLAQMIPTKMWREKPCGTDTMTRATELPNYILLLGGDITLSTQEFCDFASAEWRLLPSPVWIQILTVALVLVWFGRKYPNLINIHTSLWEHSRFLWNPIKHKAFTSVRGIRYI